MRRLSAQTAGLRTWIPRSYGPVPGFSVERSSTCALRWTCTRKQTPKAWQFRVRQVAEDAKRHG